MRRRLSLMTFLLVYALVALIGVVLVLSDRFSTVDYLPAIVSSANLLRSATPAPTATETPLQPGQGADTKTPTRAPMVPTSDDVGSEPILPTETPTLTSTPDLLGTLIVQATGTAAAFDARATIDAGTSSAQTAAPMAGVAQPFAVRDRAGAILGSGEIRLYAPSRLALDEAGAVRVEIVVNGTIPGLALTLNPPYTATPALGPTRPTPTPMPIADRQFVTVREYMGAALGGADVSHFLIDPVPPDGVRRLQANAVNWWKWNLRAAGESSVGVNRLEIRIFLPQSLDDGTDVSTETNLIPFEIEVVKQAEVSVGAVTQGVLGIAGLLATLGGATGFLLTIYRLTAKRFRPPQPPSPPEPPKT